MRLDNHSLLNDLPEHHHTIRHLKMNDNHFSKLFDQYHHIDGEIHKIEEANGNVADDYIESLKFKRVHLKDQLFSMIQATERAI
ncbi:MAG: hypothetical protein ACI88A_000720 [Paraglaciecola sp.]|jgi:uncharacterized protein YdcH (DUF465 family)